MKKSRFSGLLAACLVLAGLLTGCAPASQPGQTLPENIYQKADPAQDDTLNILMVGNSFCYYYVQELYGMLESVGIKANVCNVYYSGCSLEQHWTWWKAGEAKYSYYHTDADGRRKGSEEKVNLEWCLQQQNWDIISLQEASAKPYPGAQAHLEASKVWYTELIHYFKEQFPLSRHLWQQTWSRQVGYDRNGVKLESAEEQAANAQEVKKYSMAICEEMDLERVNSGEAWQIVREEYGYDKLCARIGKGENHEGDYYHDGDIGGGQYLNACVWFEVITGQSCVGNTYRPVYQVDGEDFSFTEEQIAMFQQSAHKAVEQMKAEQA